MTTRKSETMTSRQRVLKAINHEPVDRVPIDLGMHYSTGISAFAYWNLREHLPELPQELKPGSLRQGQGEAGEGPEGPGRPG